MRRAREVRGLRAVAVRTWKRFFDHQIPMIAAAVAFYALLALFPAIAAFSAIWGLFADLTTAQQNVHRLSAVLPEGSVALISGQMSNVAAASERGLSWAAIAGLLVSLWIANGAMMAIISGLNVAYGQKERRRYRRKLLTSLAFTIGFLVFLVVVAGVLVGQSAMEAGADQRASALFRLVSWPCLFVLFVGGLALLYRFGPSRERRQTRWLSGGGMIAGAIWLAASIAFTLYVRAFGTYDRTYGALGAVVAFMTWTWISSIVILLGAELNSETDRQGSNTPGADIKRN